MHIVLFCITNCGGDILYAEINHYKHESISWFSSNRTYSYQLLLMISLHFMEA